MTHIAGVPLSIDQISDGGCEGVLLVKVDRVFYPQVVHHLPGGKRLKEMMSVDLLVFDRTGSHIVITVEDDEAIFEHARMFLEEICYLTTNFIVRRHGKGFLGRFHIILRKTSSVERAWELLSMHAVNLISVFLFHSLQVATQCAHGIIGVFFSSTRAMFLRFQVFFLFV